MSQSDFTALRRILTCGLLGWAVLTAVLVPDAARAAGALKRIADGVIVTPNFSLSTN